jgi:hypothetical protein
VTGLESHVPSHRDSTYRWLVEDANLGEIFGATFLEELLSIRTHSGQRQELVLLHQFEASTKAGLETHLGRAQLASDEDQQKHNAQAFVIDVEQQTWADLVRDTARIAHQAIADRQRLVDLAPAENAADMIAVLDHDRSLHAFARASVAGNPSTTETIAAHLTTHAMTNFLRDAQIIQR